MQCRRLTRAAEFVTDHLLNPCRSTTLVYFDANLAHLCREPSSYIFSSKR